MDQQLNYKIKSETKVVYYYYYSKWFLLLKSHSNHNIYTHVIKFWMPYFNDNVFLFTQQQ
jgi:hypothetical protein